MSGFFAGSDLSPNRLELARQRLTAYIDLTGSNPTEQGLLFPPELLARAAEGYWTARRYRPDPRGALPARTAIQSYYRRRAPGLELPLDRIFISASTSEAYSLLFALLAGPGDNLLAPEVTYPLFEYLAAVHHLELRPYRLDEERGWRIDQASLLEQANERTRAVLVVSPHNPTGATLLEALPALDRLGLPVVCDEVFAEFAYRRPPAPPLGLLHPGLPVFHLNGISKMFALPDMKLGWIALTGPDSGGYMARLELLNDTFLSCSSLVQWMLPGLFDSGADFVAGMVGRVRDNLNLALERLAACPLLEVRPPDGGYYLFPRVREWRDEEALALYLLEEAGALVHPGYFYGYEGHGAHIMISCLTESQRLVEGLDRLTAALNNR